MESKKNWLIYLHRCLINGKCYIGQTKLSLKDRWRSSGSGYNKQTVFSNAIKKYGWENFEHIILESGLTKEQANIAEIKYIMLYDSFRNGYNMTHGGDGGGFIGHKHTQESRKKSSLSHSGSKNYFYGKKHTKETRELLSKLATGRTHTLTPEQKETIRRKKIGHIVTKETREKISKKRMGIHLDNCIKEKISKTMKEKVKLRKRNLKGHFIKEIKNGK